MIYSLVYTLSFLVFCIGLVFRPAYRQKYIATFRQRLGFGLEKLNPDRRPSIWLHAVSVGETLAIKSLVARLKTEYPGHRLLISTTTITGQELAREHLKADGYFYLPYDWRWSVNRCVDALNPDICILAETEIWPNLIKTLSRRQVPMAIVNGRLSDRSFRGYRRLPWLFGPLLRRFHTICCQSELDASRYRQCGAVPADVLMTGNLKHTLEQFEVSPSTVEALRQRLDHDAGRPIFLAASMHRGEEQAVLNAWRQAKKETADLRLVLVPRKPMEFDFFNRWLTEEEPAAERFSSETEILESDVILIDSIGQLTSLYHLASVAFVGGSLSETGGHNVLEASAAGVPVLFGPHMHNFRELRDQVLDYGAGRQVADETELAQALNQLLTNKAERSKRKRGAKELLQNAGSALDESAAAIGEALATAGSSQYVPWYYRLAASAHRTVVRLLNSSPERALRRARKLTKPVISVGGLSFGGSGKTPLASRCIEWLLSKGRSPALLTRGYRGRGDEPLVVADGHTIQASAQESGDEARMLARDHPGVVIIKDRDRYRGGSYAEQQFGVDAHVLEDGYQHRALARDCNILTLHADSIVAPRTPAQLLREPLEFAGQADLIVIQTSTRQRTYEALARCKKLFVRIPIITASFQITEFTDGDATPLALNDVQPLRLLAMAGIAAPTRFFSGLRSLGLQLAATEVFSDHHPYTRRDVERMADRLKQYGADAIITTAKDFQRWQMAVADVLKEERPPVIVAAGQLQFDDEEPLQKALRETLTDAKG